MNLAATAAPPDTATTADFVLATRRVSKQYGPVTALHPIDFSVRSGEIRALVGENGSGKSTFVGIVSGTVPPSSGDVMITGQHLTKHLPTESQNAGILTVFQDGSLLPDLTVAQNLYAGTPAAQRPKYSRITRWARDCLHEYDLDMNPLLPVSSLALGDRQLLEIVRAVMTRPKVLLLDESTSALDVAGVDRVLELMRRAAGQGSAVIFVTHRLSEVFKVADTISVLRDGHYIGTHDAAELEPANIVELMAGTKIDLEFPQRQALPDDRPIVLAAEHIAGNGFGPVDLTLRAGEIIGIAGADGNGQPGLLRGLASLGVTRGSVVGGSSSAGQDGVQTDAPGAVLRHYRHATDRGVVFVSGDRRTESLFQALPIRENLVSGVLSRLATAGIVSRRQERQFTRSQVASFGIRLGSVEHQPGSLSGGNQQKIAISRALATTPKVILIDEPTQGVDVRSRMDIYRMLRACADEGNAVVIASSDASELAGVADRIVVMSRGQVIDEIPGIGATEEQIVGAFAVESLVEPSQDPSTTAIRQASPASRAPSWLHNARWLHNGETIRVGILALLVVALGLLAAIINPSFLSPISLRNVFLVATPLAGVALAQYFVLLIGGIDVSVGATMALSVVIVSYLVSAGAIATSFTLAVVVALIAGASIGLVNALLVERLRLSAVIATIASLGIVGGIALMLRPTPGGAIPFRLLTSLTAVVGVVPIALGGLFVLALIGDAVLRRTGFGLRVRAVGLNGTFAHRLGIQAGRIRGVSYVLCGVLAAVAGILLAGQVGIGDATVGDSYTLLAIAAPVLGGASLLGGRGTLLGVFVGALLLGMLTTLATVLKIDQGANLVFIGLVTLAALVTYVVRPRRRVQA